jgi:hypothetical protein
MRPHAGLSARPRRHPPDEAVRLTPSLPPGIPPVVLPRAGVWPTPRLAEQ